MALALGPILSFRGYDSTAQQWNLAALVVTKSAPGDLSYGTNQTAKAEALWKNGNLTAYRYTFSLPVQAQSSSATYKVDNQSFRIAIPAAGKSPAMAYASCNGFSSFKLMQDVDDANALWKTMGQNHGKSPYHLLLLGGDQLYADAMWELDNSPMKAWAALSWDEGNKANAPPAMRAWLDNFFFNLYVDRWSQPDVRNMLACIPTVMMWDDHDLTDGFGSYPKERQTCKVYQAIWKSASKAFAVFQQHLKDGESRPGAIGAACPGPDYPVTKGAFSFGYIVGDIAILAADLRSQRTAESQVIGRDHWDEIYAWIDTIPSGVCHLLLMSSIPVIYPGYQVVEKLLGIFPGYQDLEDDLRDHWDSPPHLEEQLRLIKRLLTLPNSIRPLIVSGDVHVAAMGVVDCSRPQASQTSINQLVSSGIVHPGPGAIALLATKYLFDSPRELEHGVIARMMEFPNISPKFIGSRNYLSLEPDVDRPRPRIWARWFFDDDKYRDHPITKVIEPN